ncbi:hypothetical protein V1290_000358 [Bradyrhizobium sp. AZCC 1578]
MPRLRKRVCLQDGPFLDLPWLVRNQFVRLATFSPGRAISWTRPSLGVVASGFICADLTQGAQGWLKIWIGRIPQEIKLAAQPRNFGGQQWYFVCPITGRLASVVWRPPGASIFASRHAWATQVAYLSQFGTWIDRAHLGKAKVTARLLANCNPESCSPPPRPKGMRLQTYGRLAARFVAYQSKLDDGLSAAVSKWSSRYTTDFE